MNRVMNSLIDVCIISVTIILFVLLKYPIIYT